MDNIDANFGSLQWLDYSVIGAVLVTSILIGIYFRFTGGRQKTVEEYFSANHSLSSVLVGCVTMIASVSAVGVLAVCAEVYIYGVMFNFVNVGLALSTPIVAYLYLPVFYKLQYMSIYEYLEVRFGKTARLAASIANYIQLCLQTGVTLYAPALALQATTGLSSTISIVLISLICTFYTSIGGIKAVLATDIFQGILMWLTVSCVIAVGSYDYAGGMSRIFSIDAEGDRLNILKFQVDPTIRHTWWSLVIGGMFLNCNELGISQVIVQRLLSARSLKKAQLGLYIQVPLMAGTCLLISLSGLVLYAWFKGCDPVVSGEISSYDQIMPYFAKVRMSEIQGLLGLFIAGIFSATLGTTSAVLNSLSAIAVADYIKPLYRAVGREFPESKAPFFAKILGVFNGLLCMGIAFLASQMGSLLETTLAIKGAFGGPILGLFSLGLFVEVANERGAVIGTVISLAMTCWMSFGQPRPLVPKLPVSIDECNSTFINATSSNQPVDFGHIDDASYFYLYRISYMWYAPLGLAMTMVFGCIASLAVRHFGKEPLEASNPDLFTPILANRIRRRQEASRTSGGSSIFVINKVH